MVTVVLVILILAMHVRAAAELSSRDRTWGECCQRCQQKHGTKERLSLSVLCNVMVLAQKHGSKP
jgi:hypothetical protein